MAVPNHNPPRGMEGYDLGALSPEQQEKLNQFKILLQDKKIWSDPTHVEKFIELKIQTRLGNEKFLRDHPEVDVLLAGFLGDVLTQRPENIRDFAADWFTKPLLKDLVQSQLKQRENALRETKFNRKL